MNVDLTPDQECFIRLAMDEGRIASREDAMRHAMAMWEERERRRVELLAMIDQAQESIDRGEGVTLEPEAIPGFINDIIRRGRATLEAERTSAGRP